MSNDVKVTLATVQLRSRSVAPILYRMKLPITYIDGSYILDLWKRMETIGNASLWTEDVWTPQLQQVKNVLIMEKIVKLKGMAKGQLKQVNAVRPWRRVITIADITNKAGTSITDNMICGE